MRGRRFPVCRSHGDVFWTLLESQPKQPATTAADRRQHSTEPEWKTGSGERCRNSGVYQSLCTDRIKIAVMKGSRLPTCGNHGDVAWVLVKARWI
jgi:hypothetical protein